MGLFYYCLDHSCHGWEFFVVATKIYSRFAFVFVNSMQLDWLLPYFLKFSIALKCELHFLPTIQH